MSDYYDDEDCKRCANKEATKEAFRKVRKDIEKERQRTCDLVSVLLQILDKKTLNKELVWKNYRQKVKDILFYDIDP